MKEYLKHEGWEEEPQLPEGWLYKRSQRSYIDRDGNYFKSKNFALKFLEGNGGSESDIRALKNFCLPDWLKPVQFINISQILLPQLNLLFISIQMPTKDFKLTFIVNLFI